MYNPPTKKTSFHLIYEGQYTAYGVNYKGMKLTLKILFHNQVTEYK
jgi:hypothetical protein